MAVTTNEQEYARLRKYLNPYIKGPTVDAVLNALATASSYLVNNVQAVNNSLYVVTAQGNYLDLKLADYGITRDPTIGLSDDVFRTIGIQVKNRKQVRDLINNILDAVFGDSFVKTTSNSQNLEPYALEDGDTLIINFDGAHTSTITFNAAQFASIGAATAQEVANAISIGLSNLGVSGSAIVNNDGNGNYVQLLSNTIGPSSSITVMGGRSQNVLLFNSVVSTSGNFSTQWTISIQSGGNLRYTWSGGANPGIGDVQPGQYVNIYGGGFASSSNEGTFSIVSAQDGAIGSAYFEISNPTGSTGIVVQGTDSAILFYTPIRETILNKQYYAAVYQTEANILQIFVPATTQVIKRSRIGSAHLHGVTEQPPIQFIFPAGSAAPSSGQAQYFIAKTLGTSYEFYVWLNVSGGSNTDPAPAGFTGIEVTISSSDSAATVATKASTAIAARYPLLTLTTVDEVLTIEDTTASTASDAGASQSGTLGPYIFDTTQGFTIGNASTTLTAPVNGETGNIVNVDSASGFPDGSGYILISPAYFVQQDHVAGESVLLVQNKSPITLPTDGSYYQPYLTDTASGRVYAENLINSIVAAGVTVIFTVLYPSSRGLGGWESPIPGCNEVAYVYGL